LKRIGLVILDLKEYIILTVLIIFSLYFIFSNDNSQIRFLRAVAIGTFGTVQSGLTAIPNVFELQQENKLLRETNIKLANEISNLKESKLENIRLTKLLNFREENKLSFVSGRIVNKSLVQTRNTITINAGEADSVFINMPVVTVEGLAGRIVSTGRNYSIANILYNKDMRITVKSQRTRIDGILMYDGLQNLIMTNVLKSADLTAGDLIITSEYSNLFPPGIPVGTVTETGNLDNLFKKVVITPAVNFQTLEEVFILKHLPDKDRADLENSYQKKK